MKVRIISTSNYRGGAARAASRLNHSLVKYGSNIVCEMQVADYKKDISNLIKPNSNFKTGWHLSKKYIGSAIQKLQFTENKVLHSSSLLPCNLHKEINKCDADIINLHWVQGEFLSINSIASIKKPIVWTFHDCWPFLGSEHYPKDLNDRRFVDGYKLGNRVVGDKGIDLDFIAWQFKKLFFKKQFQIVCPSAWLASCVKESFLMNSWPVKVIPNSVPTSVYKPWDKVIARKLFNLPQDKKLILFGALGGTDDPRKGWEHLKFALRKIATRNENYHAIIFGQNEPKLKPDIGMTLDYVGELQDNQSLAMLYSAADLMVVPSLMENLPQSATEAQSCGTPVVGFNCTGMVDVVENFVTGNLAKAYDSDDLGKAIEWVLNDEERYDFLAKTSRKRAKNLWNEKLIAAKYEELFNQVLK